jgi:hypothetical protein
VFAAAGLAGIAVLIFATSPPPSALWFIVGFFAGSLASALLVVGVLWSTTTWLEVELPTLAGGLVASLLVAATTTRDPVGEWLRSPALWLGIALSIVVAVRSDRLRIGGPIRLIGAIAIGLVGVIGALIVMLIQIRVWFYLRGPFGP